MKTDVSIIIVNYNSGILLYNCLNSIYNRLPGLNYEVIVTDNASTDNSLQLCSRFREDPRFIFIESKENLGFAKGCNIGADAAHGNILHFLNPDTELQEGAQRDYMRVLENPHKIYVTPLLNRDGSLENGKMELPFPRDIFWWHISRNRARFWFKGASVIVSRENFHKVGKWSEDYFMYCEDLDLFWKFWKNGLEIELLDVPVFHYGGGCSSNVWSNIERETIVQKSFRKFFRIHSSGVQYFAVKLWYLIHNTIKHPSRAGFYIKAWRGGCKD